MAASLHFVCVRSSNAGFQSSPLSFLPISSRSISSSKLKFAASVASTSELGSRRIEGACRREILRIKGTTAVLEKNDTADQREDGIAGQLTCVMKFGGASVSSAERMKEVADLILSFPEERPVVVRSAMGSTTNKLLRAGEKAVSCGVSNVSEIDELRFIKELQLRTCAELGVDVSILSGAEPVPCLTFHEAAELEYFGAQVLHPQSMRPAREADIPVRVKNSYNPKALGTLITKARDMSKAVLTSIVLKRNVTMLDIVSTRMLGQAGFLEKLFRVLQTNGVGIQMTFMGASKMNDSEAEKCPMALHTMFFEGDVPSMSEPRHGEIGFPPQFTAPKTKPDLLFTLQFYRLLLIALFYPILSRFLKK